MDRFLEFITIDKYLWSDQVRFRDDFLMLQAFDFEVKAREK